MELTEFIDRISKNIFWSCNLEEFEEEYIMKKEGYSITVDKKWLKEKLLVLQNYELHEFNLYKKTNPNKANSFETSIRIDKDFLSNEPNQNNDHLDFDISRPTDEYILSIFNQHQIPNVMLLFIKKALNNGKKYTFNEIIDILVKGLKINTLKIKSKKALAYDDFINLANSYQFFLMFNYKYVFSLRKPFSINGKLVLMGYHDLDEITSKTYKKELLTYYKIATLTYDPFIEFIAFYHIIEYFFEEVKEEFKRKIKLTIIDGFEASKDDLKQILTESRFDDRIMLRLVLMKYIEKKELKEEINSYTGVNDYYQRYYVDTHVDFADAKPINDDSFYYTLSERIRLIRNSVVHRKEGKKKKYLPFEDEHKKELENEIILMRAIATLIMIKC